MPGYSSSPSYPLQPPTYPQQPGYGSSPSYPPQPTSYSQPLYPATVANTPPGQPGMPPAYSQPLYPNMQPAMPSVPVYAAPVMVGVQLPAADPGAGLATTSLVLGIIGLVFSVIGLTPLTFIFCGGPAFILGVLGIVFGAVGRRSVTRKGQATAGLVMSIVAIGLPIVLFVLFALSGAFAASGH
ncbi:MAG: DUF4190 domain-containing protein [Ktedonobacterales bacterium]